jgi:hypothetical protein
VHISLLSKEEIFINISLRDGRKEKDVEKGLVFAALSKLEDASP